MDGKAQDMIFERPKIRKQHRSSPTEVDPYEVPLFPLGNMLCRENNGKVNATGLSLPSIADLPSVHSRDANFWDPQVKDTYVQEVVPWSQLNHCDYS